MQKIWLWLYLFTFVLLVFAFYCVNRSWQSADLKTGIGDIEQALLRSRYGSWSILAGWLTGFSASCLFPFFKNKEKPAFVICFSCAYGIFAIFMMMQ